MNWCDVAVTMLGCGGIWQTTRLCDSAASSELGMTQVVTWVGLEVAFGRVPQGQHGVGIWVALAGRDRHALLCYKCKQVGE